jgi:hypothetical protein
VLNINFLLGRWRWIWGDLEYCKADMCLRLFVRLFSSHFALNDLIFVLFYVCGKLRRGYFWGFNPSWLRGHTAAREKPISYARGSFTTRARWIVYSTYWWRFVLQPALFQFHLPPYYCPLMFQMSSNPYWGICKGLVRCDRKRETWRAFSSLLGWLMTRSISHLLSSFSITYPFLNIWDVHALVVVWCTV